MVFEGVFNTIFYPVLLLPPRWSLLVVSLIVTFLITFSYKYLTDQNKMKTLKEEIKVAQQTMKEHKDNKEKFVELQKDLLTKNSQLMKMSIRPTLITFIPVIILFGWIRSTFLPAGDLFSWGTSIPLVGTGIGWLVTYILSSIIFSIIIRKALKIH